MISSSANRELVMYSRATPCVYVSIARRVLDAHQVLYRELFIDQDELYRERVIEWTGFLSVPTLIIAEIGSTLPYTEPLPLPKGASPRGINRGSMITEASEPELIEWLRQHGLIRS